MGSQIFGNRFRVEQPLGGCGSVAMYRAWDLEAERHVVLKVATGLARDIQLRLAYEAELLSSLESPHIVPLLAAGREADGYFLALPELGPTLRERIQAGPLTVPEALTVGIGMMRALEAVHALGLRHRDIKPENVLLEQSLSRALVIDFGFAMEPAPAGSLAYMAPERLGLLDYPVDERADLYEAGLVLYEAIAGKAPYEAPSLSELLRARLAADPPGLRGRRSDVPAALESIVFRLLEVEPSKRYQQAQAVARDLEEVLAGRVPVVGATDSRHRLAVPVLVGRESELTALMDALDEAERGQVQVVRLTGPSGGGKSRLLEEFARRAQSAGARVLSGRARTRSPLLPFVQLDSVFRGVVTELSASDELRETLRPWGEVLAIALEPLRAVYPVSSGPLDDSLQIARAARQLLTSLPGPTCLLLDDCQWSDTMVFDVVEECLERAAPLLIVLAFRDEVAESHRLWGYGQTRILRLATLSKSQTRELLFSMAGPLPEQVVEWAWSASQGDPFVAISSLQGLLETRMLCYEEGRWVLSEDPELKGSLSHRAGLMLAQRLDRLSLQTRAVLEAGALIGRQFVVSLISPITGLAPERVVPCLEEARRRHLLWRSDTEMVYVFSHDRIRESLLDQLPSELSSELHLRLARHLQAMDGHSVFDLAYHLHRSGRLEEAYPYARQAAEQAGERRAMELAASYFQMALQGAASAPPAVRFEISLGLGEALASLGRYGEAEGIYLELRDVAQGRLQRADLESRLSLIYSATDAARCKEAVFKGLRILGYRVAARPWLSAFFQIAVCCRQQLLPPVSDGDPREAQILGRMFQALPMVAFEKELSLQVWCMLMGVNVLERLPPSRHLGVLYGNLGAGAALAGAHKLALHFSGRAVESQRKLGDPFGIGQTLARRLLPTLATGSLDEGVALSTETARLLDISGDAWEVGAFRLHLALIHYYRGELGTALDIAHEALREARRSGDLLQIASATRTCVMASLGRVGPAPDLPVFEESLCKVHYLSALAIERLYAAQPMKAITPLLEAESTLHMGVYTASNSAWLVTAYRQTAEALPAEGAALAAKFLRLASKAIGRALAEGKTHTISYPHALRESALLAAHRGLSVRARKQLDRSIEAARRHRMDYELAWSLCERGRIGMAFGWEDAERDLGQGRSLLARIRARLPGERPAEEPTQGLSTVDRFTMLLETGRRIAGTLDVAEVRRLLVEAATALLRCQDCRVVDPDNLTISLSLMQEALRAGRTVLHDEGLPENPSESLVLSDIRSALCAPVVVHGRVECLLYVTHQRVGQLFGEEERRIGDYLASTAGGALENARNFEERRKATKRFETLFRWTGVGTAVVDERGQISEANPFFEKMLGLSSEASLFDAIFHADKTMVEEGWCMLFKGEEPLRLEVRCPRASGEMLWAQMTASRPPGQALAIAAFSDVSDRRLAQIATFQENERRLLAAELHDGVSQPLAALYFQLQRLVLDAKGARATKLQGLVQQAKGIVAEISQLMYDLRNPILGDVDALPAIAEYARGFAAEAGLQFEVEIEGGPVHGLVGTFLFRMVQEALANVRRHARASEFRLRLSAAGGEVVVTICDNGEGFDTKQVARRTTRHFGLDGMRERAELLGGRFLVNSALGQGTRVEFRLPTRQGGAL